MLNISKENNKAYRSTKYQWYIINITSLFVLLLTNPLFPVTLTWKETAQLCIQNNPELQSAKEATNQKIYQEKNSSKGYLPILTTSYMTNQTYTSGRKTEFNEAKKIATQTIYDGFKTIYNSKAANNNTISSIYSYQNTSASLRFSLRKTFIEILKLKKQLQLEKTIQNRKKKQFELISIKYNSGTEHKGALLNAEASYIEASGAVLITQRNLKFAKKKLAHTIGVNDNITVTGNFQTVETHIKDFSKIAKKHPYYKQLSHIKKSKTLSLKATKASSGLKVNANVSGGYSGNSFPPKNNGWTAGLSLTHPLWDWKAIENNIKQVKSSLNQAIANEKNTYLSIMENLENAWTNLLNKKIESKIRDKYLNAIEERAKIADIQYSIGRLNYDNWIQIENELVSSQKLALVAKVNILIAESNWIHAKGGTLENENQ